MVLSGPASCARGTVGADSLRLLLLSDVWCLDLSGCVLNTLRVKIPPLNISLRHCAKQA